MEEKQANQTKLIKTQAPQITALHHQNQRPVFLSTSPLGGTALSRRISRVVATTDMGNEAQVE